MSSTGGSNVEIRITGTLDPSVAGSTAAAAAQMDTLAVASERVGKTTTANFQQIIDSSTGVNRSVLSAKDSFLAMSTALSEQERLKSAADDLENIGKAAGGTHGSVSTATREFRALFDELSSGRTRQTPGTLAIIGQRVLGLGPAALLSVGGVLALGGALAYLVYEGVEAEKEQQKLADAFILTGRGAEFSLPFIQQQVDLLTSHSGVSLKAANAILAMEAADGRFNATLANNVNQIAPKFIEIYGQKAPEAIKRLIDQTQDLTVGGFAKLNAEMLNLSPTQTEVINGMIAGGNSAKAQEQILADLAQRGGQSLRTLKQEVIDLEKELAQLSGGQDPRKMIIPEDNGDAVGKMLDLQKQIADLKGRIGTFDLAAQQTYEKQLSTAAEINAKLDERGTILNTIAQLEAGRKTAQGRGDNAGASSLAKAEGEENAKLAKLDEEAKQKTYQTFLDGETAKADLYKSGSAQHINVLKEELAQATAVFGAESNQALAAQGRINTAMREGAAQRASVSKQENREFIADITTASRQFEQVQRDDLATTISISKSELEAKKADLDRQVADHEITTAKKAQILEQLAQDEAALDINAVRNQMTADGDDIAEYNKHANQIREIEAKLALDIAQIHRQATIDANTELKKQDQQYRGMISEVTQAERGLISNIFSGRQTLTRSIEQLGLQLVEKEIENDAEYYTQKLLYDALGLAADESTAKGGLLVHVLTEGQKTAATGAGEAARLTTKETFAAAGAAADVTAGSASILNDAYKSAAGAYSAVVGIPLVGPVLAPIAAATAFTAVAAFDTLTSFDVGTNYVPRDMVAKIHQGERIIPAADNAALTDALAGGGGGGGGAGGDVHIHAMDAKSVLRVFRSNPQAMAAGVRSMRQRLQKV